MPPELMVAEAAALGDALAARLASDCRGALRSRGLFALVLTGGSLAGAFFPRLARSGIDWSRTEFFWGDERCVPASAPESNYGEARALWLAPASVPEERVHRMPADAPDTRAAAEAYARELAAVLGTPPRLDCALLGVGADGHVCSLFPGHRALRERQRWVVAIDDSPKPPACRLTLTLPVLAAAELIVVAALGRSKAGVLREALEDRESSLPVALVLRQARRALVLLDPAAAGQ